MADLTYEYKEDGGYDCMTDAIVIQHESKTIAVIDLKEFGQDCCVPAPESVRAEAIGWAKRIVEAVNGSQSKPKSSCKRNSEGLLLSMETFLEKRGWHYLGCGEWRDYKDGCKHNSVVAYRIEMDRTGRPVGKVYLMGDPITPRGPDLEPLGRDKP